MLQRKNWMLLPEYDRSRFFSKKGPDKKIIGLDVETNDFYPNDKIFMIQIYADDLKKVFFPDSEKDMEELARYLHANKNAIISCFNSLFDMPRLFYCLGQNVDWVMKKSEVQEDKMLYTWKVEKKYPTLFDFHPTCYFDVIPLPTPDIVKKVDVRLKWSERIDKSAHHYTFKSHECTWMFGSVAQAAPFLGMKKLDRTIAVLGDNKRARWLVANRKRLRKPKDKKDLKYLLDYGMADAEISYKAAMLQRKVLPMSIGVNSPASPARRLLQEGKLPQAPKSVMNDAWQCYFGGLSLMIDRGVHHPGKKCYVYDFLSMYPSAIKNLKLINLDYIDAKGFDWDVPKKVSDALDFEYHYCVHAKVKGTVLSKEIVWWDGIPKLIPVQGEFEGWFWDVELPFLKIQDWDDIRFFAYIKEHSLQEKIEKMLLKRAQMRTSNPQRLGFKILLNSLYGCLRGDTRIVVRHKQSNKVLRCMIDEFVESFDYRDYEALSANPKSLKLEWKNITNVFKQKGSLNLVQYDTGQELYATPDHEHVVCSVRDIRHRDSISITKKLSRDIVTDKRPRDYGFAPCGWDTDHDDVELFDITHMQSNGKRRLPIVPMDKILRLIGMFLADGYIQHHNNASTARIGFGFQKKWKQKRCKEILDALGIVYDSCILTQQPSESSPQTKFQLSYDDLCQWLEKDGQNKSRSRYMPFELEQLNNRQLKLLFDEYVLFEGTDHNIGRRVCTTSATLADQMIYIGQRLGYVVTKSIDSGKFVMNFRPTNSRCVTKGDLHLTQYKRITPQPKTGRYTVYDLEVEDNHNFIANYIITGNCLAQMRPKAGAAFNAHKASLLTAMCRTTLLDTLMRNYDNAIMLDTDSLGLVGKPKYDKNLMKLDFDKSISFNRWSKEKHFYFQKEFEFNHYIAVRLKRYMMIQDWHDDWTFSDYTNENKKILKANSDNEGKKGYQKQQKIMKYAYHATTVSREFMDKIFDYITGKDVDVPEKYMMVFRQTYKRWLQAGKMEMVGGFTNAKEIIGDLDFGNYMDNWINDDNKLFRDDKLFTARKKGRFHTIKTIKQYNNVKPYIQDLRPHRDDPVKRREVYEMMKRYGANAEEWKGDPEKNKKVLELAIKNTFNKQNYSSG